MLLFGFTVHLQARQQQAELAQQEWLQMQQAAQQAQMAAASASAAQQAGSSQDEDDEDEIWAQDATQLVRISHGSPSTVSDIDMTLVSQLETIGEPLEMHILEWTVKRMKGGF